MSNAYNAHEWLRKFYHYVLMYTDEGAKAKEYLLNRGIKEETMKLFSLGYAPEKSSLILQFLKGKEFSFNNLVKDKVIFRYNNGNLADPFRGRIIFPIQDFTNRTVAFGGRAMNKENKIKYLNSPETKIFKKSDNLFGLDVAKKHITDKSYAILFEGYFDVITAHQEGVHNSIASLGTALTTNQALLIKSITKNVVIVFDSDAAGIENSFSSASILQKVGCNVKVGIMPKDNDPDDFIRENGGEDFIKNIVLRARNVEDVFIDVQKEKYNLNSSTERFEYVESVLNNLSSEDLAEQVGLLLKLDKELNLYIGKMKKVIGKIG